MRWPHWFGFRTTTGADGSVRLVGRNRFLHVVAAILAFTGLVPFAFLFDSQPFAARAAGGGLIAIALLEAAVAGGLWYLIGFCPVERRIFFTTNNTVAIDDAFLLGRVVRRTLPTAGLTALFSVRWPSESIFRLTQIALAPAAGGASTLLVPTNSPLYSWQAKRAYAALAEHVRRPGVRLRLGPPPDFDKARP